VKFKISGAKATLALDLTAQENGTSTVVGSAYDLNYHSTGFLRSGQGKIKTFEVPGSGTGTNQGTFANAINGDKWVTGSYVDSSGLTHGFICQP